jgi:hypothetical protein
MATERALAALAPGAAEPVQRQAHHQVDEGEQDEGLTPADLLVERVTDHPEHRGGERAEQGEIGDRRPPARGGDLHQCGERGNVEARAHAPRAPRRSMARPTTGETRPVTSRDTVKPRKTKPRLQPVSWLIGPASTPKQ